MKLNLNLLIAGAAVAMIATNSFATDAGFNISATLQQAIVLNNVRDLTFLPQASDTAGSYTVLPTDTNSAAFSATGEHGQNATVSFSTKNTDLICTKGDCLTSGTQAITVDNYTCDTADCVYTFDAAGKIANIGLGARETVLATNNSGTYTGTQTISLIYK